MTQAGLDQLEAKALGQEKGTATLALAAMSCAVSSRSVRAMVGWVSKGWSLADRDPQHEGERRSEGRLQQASVTRVQREHQTSAGPWVVSRPDRFRATVGLAGATNMLPLGITTVAAIPAAVSYAIWIRQPIRRLPC